MTRLFLARDEFRTPGGLTAMDYWHEGDIAGQVEAYLTGQPEPKQADLRQVQARVHAEFPD